MPYTSAVYRSILSPDELSLVQEAYSRCCELLGNKPSTPESEALLSQFVLRAFTNCDQDPELAAQRAFEVVTMLE
ncbi:hypothetical protein [Ochrobactrum sp. MYb379]|uniref:hypothetical protein n=1 Tax=Ochrobactrum sp. MYb379 TaxID=2745275 RepID=UPI00309BB890